jgi:hypothetical protein
LHHNISIEIIEHQNFFIIIECLLEISNYFFKQIKLSGKILDKDYEQEYSWITNYTHYLIVTYEFYFMCNFNPIQY